MDKRVLWRGPSWVIFARALACCPVTDALCINLRVICVLFFRGMLLYLMVDDIWEAGELIFYRIQPVQILTAEDQTRLS